MSYYINDVKYGISGGILNEIVVATVEYKKDDEIMFLSVVDIDGIFEFHLCDDDIHDSLLNNSIDEMIEASYIELFKGIDLEELEMLCDKFDDNSLLIKYIIMILRLDEKETNILINKTKNDYLTKDKIIEYNYEELL